MWKFLREYINTPDTIGAIAPSSRYLAAAMTTFINFDKARCIVEYGAGTGVFTREVAARKRPGTIYIVIEQNDRFYKILQKQLPLCQSRCPAEYYPRLKKRLEQKVYLPPFNTLCSASSFWKNISISRKLHVSGAIFHQHIY